MICAPSLLLLCAGHKQCAAAFVHFPKRVCVAANTRHSPSIDDWSLCQVSYTSSTSKHSRKMPAAARSAFKALERDSNAAIARSKVASYATTAAAAEAQSAIDTLCLVTYSDDDDAASSWQQQQQQLQKHVQKLFSSSMGTAAAATASVQASHGKASAIFAALCSEDHTEDSDSEVVGVMETLCMVSYDEEAA